MVSALFKACSEGNLETVQDLLKDVNPLDIEAKNDSGYTPLIGAVQNAHVDIVRLLLDKGADPSNASPSGLPEQHTTDQVILNLLTQAKNQSHPNGVPSTETTYTLDGSDDSQKAFYPPPPPDAYPYYPTINPSLSTVSDGSVYYPPPPPPQGMPGEGNSPGGLNNLPPPDVARMIPCRYFPACRYGPSCIFAHPPQPYYPGGGPPTQYPPYDPMTAPPYPPNYYPPFQQPNGHHPMAPLSPPPGPHMVHGRSPSEVVSPTQGPFSPNGMPPPLPYGPMSPSAYPHPSQMPVPLSIPLPPPPPLHHQPQLPPPGPQSPTNFAGSPAPPFNVQPDGSIIYSPQQPPLPNGNMNYPPETDGAPTQTVPGEGFNANNGIPLAHRDGPPHGRRGGRRISFNTRNRPPCLFFPAGRCKNGDDCRFPHVMPDGNTSTPQHHAPFFGGRGGGPRQPRIHLAINSNDHGLEEKFNNLNIRDETSRQQQPVSATQAQQPQQNGQNGTEASKPSGTNDNDHSNTNGFNTGINNRPRFPQGGKHHHHYPHYNYHNGKNLKAPAQAPTKQRVPNADEFPVLAGTVTPPSRSPLNGSGPTAAQVLQAPPPKKEAVLANGTSKDSNSTPGTTPERPRSPVTTGKDSSKIEANGVVVDNSAPSEPPVNKLSISFAAVATAAAAPDVSKEVSVSA